MPPREDDCAISAILTFKYRILIVALDMWPVHQFLLEEWRAVLTFTLRFDLAFRRMISPQHAACGLTDFLSLHSLNKF